ncbi:TerC family protein [Brevibacillus humidisoli]|uniref:TerC family protein n=1 Tax=Brevibacillus humidisoli TaxID=2895522 RepID=UPI001E42CE07|nr:TerC family protein [Brevibacillus humidisoli]UFJ41616.1 TerC family protein [Brevibacillus humidisoli]
MDAGFWLSFVQILFIDLVLSSDNAVLIGMACRGLHPQQRRRAVVYGTVGAVLLRIGLTGMATWMLHIPLIKAAGGILLLWIAGKLMLEEEAESMDVVYGKSVAQAIKTIILADFVMSLDNVLAVGGAAHGDLLLVLFGLGLSIPLLVWGSTLVARLINRYPLLIYIGAAILAYTAISMLSEDPALRHYLQVIPYYHSLVPVVSFVFIALLGMVKKKA